VPPGAYVDIDGNSVVLRPRTRRHPDADSVVDRAGDLNRRTASRARGYSGLGVGAEVMQRHTGLPSAVIAVVQALIVLCLLGAEILRTHKLVFERPLQSRIAP
jgi:hypothetical protein